MRISDWSSDVCSSDLIGRRTTMIRLALAVAGLAALAPVALAQPASSVITANKAALREPAKSRFVNAVQVYPYNEGALFRLFAAPERVRSEEHTSELQSLMRISYAVFCLKKKKKRTNITQQPS